MVYKIKIPRYPVFKTSQGKLVRPTNMIVAQARLAHLRMVRNRLFGSSRVKKPHVPHYSVKKPRPIIQKVYSSV